jgi:type 2 lantibiotic biosynthesis protein LanM
MVMPEGLPVDDLGLPATNSLVWRAATLAERLESVRVARGLPGALAHGAQGGLEPWARAFAAGDLAALERRLAWDGVDATVAVRALSDEPSPLRDSSWTRWLTRFLESARDCAGDLGTRAWDIEVASATPAPEPPFIEAWIPILRAARRELAGRAVGGVRWLSPEAARGLETHLVRQVSAIGELALFDAFEERRGRTGDRAGSRYAGFIGELMSGGWAGVFSRFPVLARHLSRLAQEWVDCVAELVAHLEADRDAIGAAFGRPADRVVQIAAGLSDRHSRGRAVSKLVFASGLSLAYKPRDVALEAAFSSLLTWLDRSGLDSAPPSPRILSREGHGWVEWIERGDFHSDDAVRIYYRRAGSLACLVYVLGGVDLHGENIVASAGGPVVVDAEMLLQPVPGTSAPPGDRAGEAGHEPVATSCLLPGLVSLVHVDAAGLASDIGGLQPAGPRASAIGRRRWHDLRSDGLHFTLERVVTPALANDVVLGGVPQRPAAHAAAILAGFTDTYRFLIRHRAALLADNGPFAGFAACGTRVLFRPSDQYGALQYILASPKYQRRGVDRSLAIETLARVFCREEARPRLWPLLRDEQRSLEALEIPRQVVAADATTIVAANGEPVDGFIACSGHETARRRLRGMGDDDLDAQIDELRAALSDDSAVAVRQDPAVTRETGADDDSTAAGGHLVQAAEAIAAALMARSRPDDGGRPEWPACGGRLDLYSGSSGILVFLAALASVAPSARWREAARRAGGAVCRAALVEDAGPLGIGACSGRPSVVYAATLAGRWLDDPALSGAALTLARRIPHAAIDDDLLLDVEGGCAGALLALLAVVESGDADDLLGLCRRCAHRLIGHQLRVGAERGAWPAGVDGRPRPGFAHGAAGIAYALARWHVHEPDPRVIEAVRSAWAYERRVFSTSGGTWPTTRSDGSRLVMAAWCHGAPGIGLARACAPAEVADVEVAAEIAAALSQTRLAPASRLDHLCCGNLGRADVMLTVGIRTGNRAWVDSGRELAGAVAERVRSQGRHGMRGAGFNRGASVPGFFQGLAGIGYQLLRASSPSTLPSVLAFDSPPAHHRRHISR